MEIKKIRKIIILGHSGFVGKNLETYLNHSARFEVIGRSLPEIDLTDIKQTRELIPFFSPENIVILGAAVKRQFGDTLDVFDQNMKIVENISRVLIESPVYQLIYMSSAAVYGEETENIDISESTLVNPTSFYGINKFTSECILRKTCDLNQITKLICLRPPLIYGPGDPANTYGPSGFSVAAREGNSITLWGDGTELREFLYIEDICRIIEIIIEKSAEGIFNAVSGKRYRFIDVINILKEKYPKLEINMRERSKNKVDNAFNTEKLAGLLGKEFKFVELREGIDKILNVS